MRSHLLEYDQVMNEQREIMYAERRRVLDGESMRNSIMKMITDYVENVDVYKRQRLMLHICRALQYMLLQQYLVYQQSYSAG